MGRMDKLCVEFIPYSTISCWQCPKSYSWRGSYGKDTILYVWHVWRQRGIPSISLAQMSLTDIL